MAKITSADIKRAFETFDSDNDGKIGTDDWKRVMSILKQHCKYELEDMDYAEFERIAKEITNDPKEADDAINKTFQMLDQSGKGYISPEDMKTAMIKLGDPLTDKEIDAVIKEITNGQGNRITLEGKITLQRCLSGNMSKITSADIKRAFETFDSDNDGKIGTDDWKRIMSILKEQCKYEFEEMDYAEFESIAKEIASCPSEADDAINKTFKMLDEGNKGYISAKDMKTAMIKLGDPLTDKEIDAVIKEITNGQGNRITLEDFRKAME
eukprot:CAMPEP_0201593156 /NCGR_PEP_ID=MMETSP0190_2-20130828/190856_1 /ASSEMBLY_ACC=CAM_ASM_000263 /TAXON_ID=37353 /ORGANISM="Rosalina sp." /LENGTH=267 /DNA_ID=CAMNT_0048052255 /DNA_START=21 /DNA_END=825 /DNA_ORIENTATION=+